MKAAEITRVASEDIRAGDWCRIVPNGTVRLLRDDDVLTTIDWVALHDARSGETVQLQQVSYARA